MSSRTCRTTPPTRTACSEYRRLQRYGRWLPDSRADQARGCRVPDRRRVTNKPTRKPARKLSGRPVAESGSTAAISPPMMSTAAGRPIAMTCWTLTARRGQVITADIARITPAPTHHAARLGRERRGACSRCCGTRSSMAPSPPRWVSRMRAWAARPSRSSSRWPAAHRTRLSPAVAGGTVSTGSGGTEAATAYPAARTPRRLRVDCCRQLPAASQTAEEQSALRTRRNLRAACAPAGRGARWPRQASVRRARHRPVHELISTPSSTGNATLT